MSLRTLRSVAALLLGAAAVAYMAHALRQAPAAMAGVAWARHPARLALGMVLQLVVLAAGSYAWWIVLERVRPGAIPPRRLVRVAWLTSPARYVPGRIWHVTSLGAMLSDAGVPVATMLASLALHMWFCVLGALVVCASLVPTLPLPPLVRVLLLGGVALGAVAGTHPALLRAACRLVARTAREPAMGWPVSWGAGALLLVGYVVLNVAGGVAASLVVSATTGLPAGGAARVVGANAAAFLAGYFSLVPAGLGVREAIMTLLLSPATTTGVAATAAVILRASAVVADAVLAAAALALGARDQRSTGA